MNPMENGAAVRVKEKLINNIVPQYFDSTAARPMKTKRSVYASGGRARKFGGGRTNLIEELGRVEAKPSNRNRRAEVRRVHHELNRGLKGGGIAKKGKGIEL